jgi:hypothetical protein
VAPTTAKITPKVDYVVLDCPDTSEQPAAQCGQELRAAVVPVTHESRVAASPTARLSGATAALGAIRIVQRGQRWGLSSSSSQISWWLPRTVMPKRCRRGPSRRSHRSWAASTASHNFLGPP